jgi:hypothetical protein
MKKLVILRVRTDETTRGMGSMVSDEKVTPEELLEMLSETRPKAWLTLEHPNPIVRRTRQFYAQTAWDDPSTYNVEFRRGSPQEHFRTTMHSPKEVCDFLVAWAADEAVQTHGLWEHVTMPQNTVH